MPTDNEGVVEEGQRAGHGLSMEDLAHRLETLELENRRLRERRNSVASSDTEEDMMKSVFKGEERKREDETQKRLEELERLWRTEQARRQSPMQPDAPMVPSVEPRAGVIAQTPMYLPVSHTRQPNEKQSKLNIEKFTGKETYPGLGCDFVGWGRRFLRQVALNEEICGFLWSEETKVDVLMRHLGDEPRGYVQQKIDNWWDETPQCWYVMEHLRRNYVVRFSQTQVDRLFTVRKDPKKSWGQHHLYLLAASEACGGRPDLVLENVAYHAATDPDLRILIRSRYQPDHPDPLRHAEELIHYAQSIDMGSSLRLSASTTANGTRNVASNVHAIASPDERRCWYCHEPGHRKKDCPSRKERSKAADDGDEPRYSLAVQESSQGDVQDEVPPSGTQWILDTGSCRHLIGDTRMLDPGTQADVNDDRECILPNGETIAPIAVGSVTMSLFSSDEWNSVCVKEIEVVPGMPVRILSYAKLERNGAYLNYEQDKRWLKDRKSGDKICRVYRVRNNLVVVERKEMQQCDVISAVMDAISSVTERERDTAPIVGTLAELHVKLGHLAYETIERMARDQGCGIKLTDHKRVICVTCAQGKQTRSQQPKNDTGRNAPTDRLGGVICSDLKGPITPHDRQGNRYLVNFVDYKSNYCRVFLAKTKEQAAQKFRDFLLWFEKRFDCRVHVLRTDGGLEYSNIDAFCRKQGVRRQISELWTRIVTFSMLGTPMVFHTLLLHHKPNHCLVECW